MMGDEHAEDPGAAQPLAWQVDIASVAGHGADGEKSASADERAALAKALDLVSCDKLTASWRIKRTAGDGFRVRGKLAADVVQACVVTLAPVHETIAATFVVEFVPAAELESRQGGALDLDDDAEFEAIAHDELAIGQVVFEELSASINPYPRRPGAEYVTPAEKPEAPSNPFAALQKFKSPSGKSGN